MFDYFKFFREVSIKEFVEMGCREMEFWDSV